MEQWPSTMEKVVMQQNFWQGKKVLVTGHTGFKGSWLCLWLQKLGAEVSGFSLAPTSPSLFEQAQVSDNMTSMLGDIRDTKSLALAIENSPPDIVFHLAAQSLVRASYLDPIETYSTNVMGSLNLLEAIKNVPSVKAVIMVSTDKCYENVESGAGYNEDDRLGGYDPYSSSKACLELMVASYRQAFLSDANNQLHIATARAGNVIGGGDYAQDRLIPDILQAISENSDVELRYPHAVRPWQHVLEPLSGYMLLAEKLYQQGKVFAQAWNFGPMPANEKTVHWVTQYMVDNINTQAKIIFEKLAQPHETSCLKLNCAKSNSQLNWQAVWNIEQTLDKVIAWQQASFDENLATKAFCLQQIDDYCQSRASFK